MTLQTNVRDAAGIYKRYSSRLEKLGIFKFEDFLFHFPFRYDDFSLISSIKGLQEGEIVTIKGNIVEIKNIFTRGFRKIQKALISDSTGQIEVIWFNQPYLIKMLSKGDFISLSGKVGKNVNSLSLISPEFEILDNSSKTLHTGRLVPIYPETQGISSKWMRKQVDIILSENKDEIEEYLPSDILKQNNLIGLHEALKQIHFPNSSDEINLARERLSFDELLIIQSAVALRKQKWAKNITGKKMKMFDNNISEFIKHLPFELTGAQKKATEEILTDMLKKTPMNRLLEGDVGSGKTVVGAISSYLSFLNKYQTALIAPTEILAIQHYKTFSDLLSRLGIKVELITSTKKLETKDFDVLIGTHALIGDKVNFDNLGLVIIDEQQRFGVEQRSLLRKKGDNPHFLTMTATPIPRTVALTLYGDLSLSIIDEMPKMRKVVKTWLVAENKRTNAYRWIEKEILQTKSQAFIICPFIEESETITTIKAAKKEYEHLKNDIFKNLKVTLLHGKMKTIERNKILDEFKMGKWDILIATPIVEVGIDIPNATIIVIEASERFGLSQLHQLRGRVGRGEKQSYCLLFTQSLNPKTLQRLKGLESIHFGARLAELDLEIRGSGDVYGTAQHGFSMLKIARLSDFKLVEKTRIEAQRIISEIDKYPKLLNKINEINSTEVSPD